MEPLWRPTEKQELFLSRWEDEVFYGGAAGPGKTDALVMGALRYTHRPTYRALLLRRTFGRMGEILERSHEYYPYAVPGAYYSDHIWKFPCGATCRLGHMEHEQDKYNYRGGEYQYVGWDELTEFTLTQYLFITGSRVRSVRDPTIPPQSRSASNPCDIGHLWVKERFVTIAEPGTTYIDPQTGLSRIFIPGLMEDNPYLFKNDPNYDRRLRLLPDVDYKRFRHGIWDAFEGQVFGELNKEVHGYDPKKLEIPPEWERYRSFDWGYSSPASVGWWAIDYEGKAYRYRAWYLGKKDEQRRIWAGLKMSDTEIARGIKEREQGEKVNPGPADPKIWNKRRKKDGLIGPSVAEGLAAEGIYFIPGDNNRILGKHQFHARLRLDDEGKPGVYFSLDDEHFWRTIPELREDPKNPEDVDTDQEDHIYDEARYFFMFRPIAPRVERKGPPAHSFQGEREKYLRAKHYAERYGTNMNVAYERTR